MGTIVRYHANKEQGLFNSSRLFLSFESCLFNGKIIRITRELYSLRGHGKCLRFQQLIDSYRNSKGDSSPSAPTAWQTSTVLFAFYFNIIKLHRRQKEENKYRLVWHGHMTGDMVLTCGSIRSTLLPPHVWTDDSGPDRKPEFGTGWNLRRSSRARVLPFLFLGSANNVQSTHKILRTIPPEK